MNFLNGSDYLMMKNSTDTDGNDTTAKSTEKGQIWSVVPIASLVILIVATLANGFVLQLFIRHRHLRTAFNIYVINLVFCNFVDSLIQLPLYLVNNLKTYWWLGHTSCTIYIYGFFIQAIMVCSHALITINRIWAVTSPVTYRTHHTKKASISLCAAAWVYVHAVLLPGFIIDAMYYRVPIEHGCFMDSTKQHGWFIAYQFMVFSGPVAVMVFAYPYIAYKSLKKRTVGLHTATAPAPLDASTKRSRGSTLVASEGVHKHDSATHPPKPTVSNADTARARRRTSGFLLLTLLTVSMVVAWVPPLTFYTVLIWKQVDWPVFAQVATVLCLMETVYDPLFFTLALKDVRTAIKSTGRVTRVGPK